MGWGKQDVDHHQYRAAANRFIEASRVPGDDRTVASSQAAAILSRLGSHALAAGACRSAVTDLRRAGGLAPGEGDPEILQRAEACALTCLSVDVVVDENAGIDDSRVERLGAEVRRKISADGTEFLRVRDPATPPTSECLSVMLSGSKEAGTFGPRRVRAIVKLSGFSVLRSPATSTVHQHSTPQSAERESVVSYRQYDEVISGAITGAVTLTDRRTGLEYPAIPVRAEGETIASWVRGPVSVVATDDASPRGGSTGVLIHPKLQDKTRVDDRRREARTRLVVLLLSDFADKAARAILAIVDGETGVADPLEIPDVSRVIGDASEHAGN
jgi:hypothetical protein